MGWNLFIDDLRNPPYTAPDLDYVIARNVAEAKALIVEHGLPQYIAFDHDLGDGFDAPVLVDWMINLELDGVMRFPDNFSCSVHSSNPEGFKLKAKLDNYFEKGR